jgi:uncharacterized membrane protein
MKARFSERMPAARPRPKVGPSLQSREGVKVEKSITINRAPHEVYAAWRNFENLPRFMHHLESVTERENGISHWVVQTPTGKRLEWDAEIIEDRPNEMISWQSLDNADVKNAGSIWFKPARTVGATDVKLSMKYSPPGGKVTAALAKIFGTGASKTVVEDLSRFKEFMEADAVSGTERRPRPTTRAAKV